MSLGLIMAVETGKDYLHSPVDDLESCFWVALWSVLFNKDHEELLSIEEHVMRESLIKIKKAEAVGYFGILEFKELSNIMQHFLPVLSVWWEKIRCRDGMWKAEVLDKSPAGAGKEYYLLHFHHFALQGVLDILEVMAENWDGEISWESWTSPVALKISEQ